MPESWKFSALKTGSGDVLLDWLNGDAKLQARLDSYLRRLKEMNPPWPFPIYRPLGSGVGEIRFDLRKVEHRVYGFFGPGRREFTVILASSDKKTQKRDIQTAKELRAAYQLNRPTTEPYDVT